MSKPENAILSPMNGEFMTPMNAKWQMLALDRRIRDAKSVVISTRQAHENAKQKLDLLCRHHAELKKQVKP